MLNMLIIWSGVDGAASTGAADTAVDFAGILRRNEPAREEKCMDEYTQKKHNGNTGGKGMYAHESHKVQAEHDVFTYDIVYD